MHFVIGVDKTVNILPLGLAKVHSRDHPVHVCGINETNLEILKNLYNYKIINANKYIYFIA